MTDKQQPTENGQTGALALDALLGDFRDRLTIDEVEKLLGRRIDRRKKYRVIDGEVCNLHSWTQSCSGCHETNEGYNYPGTIFDKNNIALGSGCSECGHQGKVRVLMWFPTLEANVADEPRGAKTTNSKQP